MNLKPCVKGVVVVVVVSIFKKNGAKKRGSFEV